jgi:uncharacterized protein YndB with AHSA1/START domain
MASVWKALVDPEMITLYLFGTTVESEWKVGGPITYTLTEGDGGTVLELSQDNNLSLQPGCAHLLDPPDPPRGCML